MSQRLDSKIMNVTFVRPCDLPLLSVDPDTYYIGSLQHHNDYAGCDAVREFVRLSNDALTPIIAPLLMLSRCPEITVRARPRGFSYTIRADIADIEERIDGYLHGPYASHERHPKLIYQSILGKDGTVW